MQLEQYKEGELLLKSFRCPGFPDQDSTEIRSVIGCASNHNMNATVERVRS